MPTSTPAEGAWPTRSSRRSLAVAAALVALLSATACSSSRQVGSDTAPGTGSVAGTDTSSPTGSTDSIAAGSTSTSTAVETTTTEGAPAPLALRSDGLGAYDLGTEITPVYDGVIAQLGEPAFDTTSEYPMADGLGRYTTEDGSTGFVAPYGRELCWSSGFCIDFAGATMTSMSFTGWAYRDDPEGSMHSPSGVTIGTLWSDSPTMTIDEGGCYSEGSGHVDGILLTVISSGVPFVTIDAAGNSVNAVPPRNQVSVYSMTAGATPSFLYGDC